MKAILLCAALSVAFSGTLQAQHYDPDYRFEIGVNGGPSYNSLPNGPSTFYQGTQTMPNSELSFRFNYNISPVWQVALNVGETKWETKTMWPQSTADGQQLGSREVDFVIANPAINTSVQVNRVVPFYSRFHGYNKANLYFGVLAGLMYSVNDGSLAYGLYKQSPEPNLIYTSKYNYGMGIGYVGGIQVGYTYYIVPKIGINIEAAARYTYVGTNDTKYGHANDHFSMFYFPETIGVRFRF